MTPLRQRMTEDMQVRNLSRRTQSCYLQHLSLFARHFRKSPDLLGPEAIRTYQVFLTNEKKWGAQFDLPRHRRPPLPVQSHPPQTMDLQRGPCRSQEAPETACPPQP